MEQLTTHELIEWLAAMLPAMTERSTALGMVGPPGVGKSYAVTEACKRLGYEQSISRPLSTCNECDVAGYIVPDLTAGRARQLHPDLWPISEEVGDRPFVVDLEELPQSTEAVQRALMPVLYVPRKLGTYYVPDTVRIVWTGNRRTDRAGAGRVLSTIYSRSTMVEVRSDVSSFLEHAERESFALPVREYLRFHPEHLNTFAAAQSEQAEFACERTWEQVSMLLHADLPLRHVLTSACGLLGSEVGASFVASVDSDITAPDVIIAGPEVAPVPSACSVAWATAHVLASYIRREYPHANGSGQQLIDAATRYAVRLPAEIAAITITACCTLDCNTLRFDHVRAWCSQHTELARPITR